MQTLMLITTHYLVQVTVLGFKSTKTQPFESTKINPK